MHQTEGQLNELITSEIKGVITRARIQWVEEGERSTKYFLGLEKSAHKKKSITKLITESRDILTSQEQISAHVVEFYQNLFSSKRPNKRDINSYLDASNLCTIEEDLSNELEEPMRLNEIDAVVKNLKNNKSPGWDGLTNEFYKKFWASIKQILYNTLNEAIDKQSLPPSLRVGIVTLIPKPKSPMELNYIKNWRPITLLNTDNKIFYTCYQKPYYKNNTHPDQQRAIGLSSW